MTSAASATTGKTRNVNAAGYYFYDATADNGSGANSGLWIPLVDPGKQQFYMPTVLLPTDAGALPDNVNYSSTGSGAGTSYTVDLFNLYKSQYDSPAAKSATTSSLQTGTAASNYHYFVLYYDTNVFDNTSISTSGILSYSLRTGYVLSEKTFVNVVLREK
ncbi:hypothetical protein [Dysgonomonas sp. GY617]|uniref:hypothetical protein n=1 Tax=Dysgonomonas sp. GY617 TaxID=2780420 RepID=UPI0018844B0E|nr:hypothetical protein [Dysgonomonas sp. GY617]MBF0575553.1 hypothetical protein [Dysgonomonas sp. GY617]